MGNVNGQKWRKSRVFVLRENNSAKIWGFMGVNGGLVAITSENIGVHAGKRLAGRLLKHKPRRMSPTGLLAAFFLVCMGWFVTPSLAGEEILSFNSRIVVHADASLTITETIRARATGDQIKRGIFRDLPVGYEDRSGNTLGTTYRIVSVTRDGQPLSYFTENRSGYLRIYLGSRDALIEPGAYTFVLTYRTENQVGYFRDFDKIYWNVTGDEWAFPINQAEASVELPPGGRVLQRAAYTGPKGATGQDFTSSTDANGNASFRTTRVLKPGEGMTIAVGWPKGLVHEPSAEEKAARRAGNSLSSIVALVGLLLVLAFYLYAWNRVGRDPKAGTAAPRATPPEGFSPAAVRYVYNMGFDDRAFAVAVVNMAVKGYIGINDGGDDDFTLSKAGGRGGDKRRALSKGEAAVMNSLLGARNSIEMDNENHRLFSQAMTFLRDALDREFSDIHFNTNRLWFFVGAALSLLAIGATVLTAQNAEETFAITIFMAVPVIVFGVVGRKILTKMKTRKIPEILFAGLVFLAALGIILSGVFDAAVQSRSTFSVPGIAAAIGVIILNPLFFHLLKAPTLKGRRIMDQIEGFRLYLAATDEARQSMPRAPEATEELFERYLPYAMALDVEPDWSDRFTAALAGTAASGGSYHPHWYRGQAWGRDGARGLGDCMGRDFTSAMSSASSAPGNSGGGGSSGGGSSGGGGGGGGGGGF